MTPSTEPFYAVRNSLMDAERQFRLGPNAIEWDTGSIAYKDVRQVRLFSYVATGTDVTQITIKAIGRRPLKIRSHSFVSLGRFESRMADFSPFVRELLLRLAAKTPEAEYVAGSTALRVMWIIVAAMMVLLGLLLLVVAFDGGGANLGTSALPALGVLTIGSWATWRGLRHGGGHHFKPEQPPEKILPPN